MLCDSNLLIRRVYFTNAIARYKGSSFYYYSTMSNPMSFVPILDENVSVSTINTSLATTVSTSVPNIEKPYAWSLPFVAGEKYGAWFSGNADFYHLSIVTTTLFGENDPGIVFKFAYSESR